MYVAIKEAHSKLFKEALAYRRGCWLFGLPFKESVQEELNNKLRGADELLAAVRNHLGSKEVIVSDGMGGQMKRESIDIEIEES